MNRKRYINELSESEQGCLQTMVKASIHHRERQRAQAILWSHQGQDMESILRLLKVDRDTLSSWFSRWEREGITGLQDKPRSGRPAANSEAEKKILAQAEPGIVNGKQFTQQVNDQLALQVSWWTLKRILQQAGFTWRRVKKSLKNQRDEQMFSFFKEEILPLRHMEQQGEIELWPLRRSSMMKVALA